MGTIIILSILALIAIAAAVVGFKGKFTDHRGNEDRLPNKILYASSGAVAIITLVIAGITSAYTQDPGEANVVRSWTGNIKGQTVSEGLHFKAPWDNRSTFDIRNQQVIFAAAKGEGDKNANGPQVTIQDKEGVTANVDITVRYSVNPDSVTDIYKKYHNQENFVTKFIENDIRAGVRLFPAKYGTLELLTSARGTVEAEITDYLAERWEEHGVRVESVSLQEIRYSDDVKARFDAAQSARIEVEKAQADLEAAEVSSQQKIVQAEAEAQANRLLNESLSSDILSQRYLDTLEKVGKNGNLVIVPDGFNGILNMQKQ